MFESNYERMSTSEKYVTLALAADRLPEDRPIVFTYFGPSYLKRCANRWVSHGVGTIISELKRLEEDELNVLEDEPPIFRRTYLYSQVRSLRNLLALEDTKLTGQALIQAVSDVLGFVPPAPYDVDQIKSEELKVLSRYKYNSYRDFKNEQAEKVESKITDNDVRSLSNHLTMCFKNDMRPHILLGEELAEFIDKSQIKIARYREGYPSCYYIYRGRGRASIYLSGEHRKSSLNVLRTLMHEFCPGHHVYYLYREMLFKLGLLGVETTIDLIYSSETPVSEGVAETGLSFLDSLDPELLKDVKIANAREHFCKKALYNVWYHRFIKENMTREAAASYLLEQCGFEGARIDTWLDFIDDWRVYYPSYPVGTEKMKEFLDAGGGLAHFYLPKSLPVLEKLSNGKGVL